MDGNILRASEGEHDDRARAFALALAVLVYARDDGRAEDDGLVVLGS